MSNTLVIIPTYNEKENIEAIICAVFSQKKQFDILVIDDNSPDGTSSIVKKLQQEYSNLYLEIRKEKKGLGSAYIHGFMWAIAKNYDYIIEMDADFSHNPNDLIRLYNACANDGNDVAIGSRYITGVNVVNWPMGRVLMSYYASAYVRIVTGLSIRDTTAGFMCYTAKVLENIDLDRIKFTGYAFQIEMKFTSVKMGYKVVEVPIVFTDRTMGESKMSGSIFKEAIFGVLKLRFKKVKRRIN